MYSEKKPDFEWLMPGMKQFVTCAFMITATKGKKMSFQISIERGGKKSFQRVFVLLKCSAPEAADPSEEGEEVKFKNKTRSHFQTVSY